MADAHFEFDKRLRKIGRRHHAMERGYTTVMRSDGLIVAKPRRARVRVPVKGLVLMAVAFFGFKGFLLAALGPETYDARLLELQNGTMVEEAGAWAMQADRVSVRISELLGPVLR